MSTTLPNVSSELGRLREIAIHTPGPELDLMTPDNIEAWHTQPDGTVAPNPDYLLFDDLVLLRRLRAEHDQIAAVLRATCGEPQTHQIRDLLRTVLYDEDAREQLVDAVIDLEQTVWNHAVDAADRTLMLELDPHTLLEILIGGTKNGRRILRWPLPNTMFTRDLGAIVGHSALLTFARTPARAREMLLSRAIFRFHPRFDGIRTLDIRDTVAAPALEGGDVLVVSKDQVLIGVGERTTEESALAAARLLLSHEVQCVYLVQLSVARSTMHLDTVFTLIDHDRCLAYAPLILEPGKATVKSIDATGTLVPRRGTLLEVLAEDGLPLDPIPCGGDDPVQQAREQWSDGANAFALAPGRFMLYGRNEQTLRRLNTEGYEVLTSEDYCRNAALLLSQERKTVVAIDGSELSRGRGGPRCLTMPLRRD